jgi:hypothetical protein
MKYLKNLQSTDDNHYRQALAGLLGSLDMTMYLSREYGNPITPESLEGCWEIAQSLLDDYPQKPEADQWQPMMDAEDMAAGMER